jgi:hypothetical protein
VSAMQSLREAQAEVNALRKRGQAGTTAFRNAELSLLEAQLSVRSAGEQLAATMTEEGKSARDVSAALVSLGREAGLTAREARVLAAEIQGVTDKANGVPSLVQTRFEAPGLQTVINQAITLGNIIANIPRTITTTVNQIVNRSGGDAAGAIRMGTGGIASGFITQGPTYRNTMGSFGRRLSGEGRYITPYGTGAEAVIPLHAQSLDKLGKHITANMPAMSGPTVHIHGDVYAQDGTEFGKRVVNVIERQLARTGSA